jgi:hypothetical protein
MTDKQVKLTIGISYSAAAIMILAGVILKTQHNPNGSLISLIGFIPGMLTIIFDRTRFKKK